MQYRAWEIWLVNVKFDDNPSIVKKRPVLVVPTGDKQYEFCKMTGTMPRGKYEHRINIRQGTGLNKDTTIRSHTLLSLKDTDFIHKIGNLHAKDIVDFKRKEIYMINCVP